MSSHLTIIQGGAAAPNVVQGGTGHAGKAAANNPLAAFAAILDALLAGAQAGLGGTGDGDGTAGKDGKIDPLANPMTGSTVLTGDAKAAHKAGAKDGDDKKDEDADPLAAFVDLLSQLDAALQSGVTPDPALLQKLDAAVADLSKLLGFDPDAPIAPGTAGGGNTLIDQLAGKTESLARALDKNLTEPLGAVDTKAQKTVADLTRRLDALAHKLEGGLSKDDLAKLGFDAELKLANTDTAKKLDALVNGKVGLNAAANGTPDLAAPSLKPSEVEAADNKHVHANEKADRPDHKKPNDDKHAERIAAARIDARADAAADTSSQQPTDSVDTVTQPATQASTSKIDGALQLRGPAAAYQANPQINMPHLAFEMVRQVHNGKSRFQIRLDPPELGRIDVHMHVDNSGNVSARMTVDKAETLDLLQRDQSSLEKALAQAGLDGNKPSLEFSLRQNPFARPDGGQQRSGHRAFNGGGSEAANTVDAVEPAPTLYRGTVSAGGVNLFV